MEKSSEKRKPKITFSQVGQIIFTLKQILLITYKAKPKLLITVILINIFLGFIGVLSFYLEKLILDNLIAAIGSPNASAAMMPILLILALAISLSLARNIIQSYSGFLNLMLTRYFDVELDLLISEKMSTLDVRTIEDPDFRDRVDKVQRESGRRAGQLMSPFSDIPQSLIGFVTSAGILLAVHPLVSLVVVFLSLPRIFVNHKFIKMRYKFHSEVAVDSRISNFIREYLIKNKNFLELKILNISNYLMEKLKSISLKIVDGYFVIGKKQINTRGLTFIPLSIFELFVASILVYWVVLQRITVGTFQLYLRALRSVEDNLSQLAASLTSVYENYIYVADLTWLLDVQPKINDFNGEKFNSSDINIEFKNVSFKYRDDSPLIIKNLDFKIKAGDKIAIVGENGAGKTTLIKLISRFYDPYKGSIFINNKNLNLLSPTEWRKNIAVLFQQFEQYPFTAKESIAYGDIENIKNMKEIKETAKKVGIHDYIESLPLKYDNPLSPEFVRGVNPSTGQWQRIGLARMLFKKKSKIIILDEPTSNIDPEGEEEIFNELVKITKNKILIFVTQRFSTTRIADRIFVVDKGKIIEQGTHVELMKRNGKYAKLYNLQAKAYVRIGE